MQKLSNKKTKRKPGAPPGSLDIPLAAEKPTITIIAYGPDGVHEEVVEDLNALNQVIERWPVTWVNVDGLGDLDTIKSLGSTFKLHVLALEDVLHLGQRPKVEEYDENLFIVLRMLEPEHPVKTEQLSMFLGDNFVVTFQEHAGDCLDPVRKRIREGLGRIRKLGADYLAYCLMDAVVDAYYPFLDQFSERIESLEAAVLHNPSHEMVATIHAYKNDLLAIRRVMGSLREAINELWHGENTLFKEGIHVFLRDCYDHVVHILDTVDSFREVVGGLLDIYLSSVSNRMNEIMKVLTIMATIFIPLSFIVGLYGMNFDPASPWNMPELKWYFGYPVLIITLVVIVIGQLAYFWRKGWIFAGRQKKDKDSDD